MAKDLTKGSPTKLLLAYSVPLLFGNVFQQFYSMVDAIIVGKFIGVDAFAAVGATGGLAFLIMGFIWGLTGGFAVVVAQKYGAKDEEGLRRSVGMSIILSLLVTVILTVLSLLILNPLLKMMNTPDNIIVDSRKYISIIFLGIICTFVYNMAACILRAIGDSKTPLYFLIVSSILNIILDLLFTIVFHMGVSGVAWATVISQGVASILCYIYTKKKYSMLHLSRRHLRYNHQLAWQHLRIALPMAFQFSIIGIGVLILQGALNGFGSKKIAAYTAASKVQQLAIQPAGTFAVALSNYTGQNLGAGRIDRIKQGVKTCSILTISVTVVASIILIVFGRELTGLFIEGNDEEVFSSATQYLNILAIFLPVLSMLFIFRSTLQGMGRSFMPFLTGIFELIARSVAAFTLPLFIGYTGICLADPIAWFSSAIPLGLAYIHVIRKFELSMKEK